jgi:hypothetical protein
MHKRFIPQITTAEGVEVRRALLIGATLRLEEREIEITGWGMFGHRNVVLATAA